MSAMLFPTRTPSETNLNSGAKIAKSTQNGTFSKKLLSAELPAVQNVFCVQKLFQININHRMSLTFSDAPPLFASHSLATMDVIFKRIRCDRTLPIWIMEDSFSVTCNDKTRCRSFHGNVAKLSGKCKCHYISDCAHHENHAMHWHLSLFAYIYIYI